MPNLSDKAKELLRKAVARAKEIPQGFDMHRWVVQTDRVPCGTAGCLAFEICVAGGITPNEVFREYNNGDSIADRAKALLGHYGKRIFFVDDWPFDLQEAYLESPCYSLERALALEQAVERWIEGDGSFNVPE